MNENFSWECQIASVWLRGALGCGVQIHSRLKRLKKQSWISIWKVNSSVGIEMYNIHKRLTWRTNLLRTLSFDICRLRHSRLWSPFKFSAIILYILLMVLLILHILKKVPISSDEKLVDNNALGMYYVLYIYMY